MSKLTPRQAMIAHIRAEHGGSLPQEFRWTHKNLITWHRARHQENRSHQHANNGWVTGAIVPPEYHVSVTTWDHGKGHSQALADGPVKDHLLALAAQSLGLLPEINKVELHCTNHSVITIYRKETAA